MLFHNNFAVIIILLAIFYYLYIIFPIIFINIIFFSSISSYIYRSIVSPYDIYCSTSDNHRHNKSKDMFHLV